MRTTTGFVETISLALTITVAAICGGFLAETCMAEESSIKTSELQEVKAEIARLKQAFAEEIKTANAISASHTTRSCYFTPWHEKMPLEISVQCNDGYVLKRIDFKHKAGLDLVPYEEVRVECCLIRPL